MSRRGGGVLSSSVYDFSPRSAAGVGAPSIAEGGDDPTVASSIASRTTNATTVAGGTAATQPGFQLVAECETDNLACARACPGPLKDSFVLVGLDADRSGDTSYPATADTLEGVDYGSKSSGNSSKTWHAELWQLKRRSDENEEDYGFGVFAQKTLSFQGGSTADEDQNFFAGIGDGKGIGSIIASELALSIGGKNESPHPKEREDSPSSCLLLCTMTDTGYVMTHVRNH